MSLWLAGFSLHANVAVPAADRARLERLCRYTARPPLAIDRLELLPDGRLLYRFKRPWRNGATHASFEPLQLLEKLAALVPAPRANLVRYHGILGPAAKWRSRIVAGVPGMETHTSVPICNAPACLSGVPVTGTGVESAASSVRHGRNYAWAELMRRVFSADV